MKYFLSIELTDERTSHPTQYTKEINQGFADMRQGDAVQIGPGMYRVEVREFSLDFNQVTIFASPMPDLSAIARGEDLLRHGFAVE